MRCELNQHQHPQKQAGKTLYSNSQFCPAINPNANNTTSMNIRMMLSTKRIREPQSIIQGGHSRALYNNYYQPSLNKRITHSKPLSHEFSVQPINTCFDPFSCCHLSCTSERWRQNNNEYGWCSILQSSPWQEGDVPQKADSPTSCRRENNLSSSTS